MTCSCTRGLVTPFARRAVTSTGTSGFGAAGSWRTSSAAVPPESAALAPVSPDGTRATIRKTAINCDVRILYPQVSLRLSSPKPHQSRGQPGSHVLESVPAERRTGVPAGRVDPGPRRRRAEGLARPAGDHAGAGPA